MQVPPRPRWYKYPTFEGRLPCIFPAVNVRPQDLVRSDRSATTTERPKLICDFCVTSHIKAFASIAAFWAHLVHQHQATPDPDRLCEVRRTASLWKTYWDLYSQGGKRDNPTMARLKQALQSEFCWKDVLEWGLR